MKKYSTRILAMLLCVLLFTAILPMPAVAAEPQSNAGTKNYVIKVNIKDLSPKPGKKLSRNWDDDINLSVYQGDKIKLGIDSLGKGWTYQWWYSKDGSYNYKKIKDATKRTLTVKVGSNVGCRYYLSMTHKKYGTYVTADWVLADINLIQYYALLIGETYEGTDSALPGDVDLSYMQKLLYYAKTPTKTWWDDNMWSYVDCTASQICSAINEIGSYTDYNDVLLFYYSGHGDPDSLNEWAGSLYCTGDTWLSLQTLASALFVIPCGKVIVMIDSCGSGAAVLPNVKALNPEKSAIKFNQAVINAFANVDNRGGTVSNVGSFTNKFYVLTSSSYGESSYYHYDPMVSHFTYWLYKGAKPNSKGNMAADANKNKAVTLAELYTYIKNHNNSDPTPQHVQVYPSKCSLVIFRG